MKAPSNAKPKLANMGVASDEPPEPPEPAATTAVLVGVEDATPPTPPVTGPLSVT